MLRGALMCMRGGGGRGHGGGGRGEQGVCSPAQSQALLPHTVASPLLPPLLPFCQAHLPLPHSLPARHALPAVAPGESSYHVVPGKSSYHVAPGESSYHVDPGESSYHVALVSHHTMWPLLSQAVWSVLSHHAMWPLVCESVLPRGPPVPLCAPLSDTHT